MLSSLKCDALQAGLMDVGSSDIAAGTSQDTANGDRRPESQGSIVLLDPATSSIIGTLRPESAGVHDSQDNIFNTLDVQRDADPAIPPRRSPTYSYRLSLSDVSLRTFNNLQTGFGTGGTLGGSVGLGEAGDVEGESWDDNHRQMRRSSMADEGSFWTARGTLHSSGSGTAEAVERKVIVAYIQADASPPQTSDSLSSGSATMDSLDIHDATLRAANSRASTLAAGTDSPFPSRILHLFPRLSTLPRLHDQTAGTSPGNTLVSAGTASTQRFTADLLDPAAILASAQSHAEAAFWRLVMPGIGGLFRWTYALGTAYEQLSAYWPRLSEAVTAAPLFIDTAAAPDESGPGMQTTNLYSEETIYTLRLPPVAPPEKTNGSAGESGGIDIGPTVKPVWVRKRAALPVFETQDIGWGRDVPMFR